MYSLTHFLQPKLHTQRRLRLHRFNNLRNRVPATVIQFNTYSMVNANCVATFSISKYKRFSSFDCLETGIHTIRRPGHVRAVCVTILNHYVFIAHFSAFDLHLKNIITAVNCRKNKKSIEENLLEDLETTPVLVKSSAKDFGLAEKFEYINQVIELIENEHIWKLDQYVDTLRWSYCDELTSVSFFKIDNLLAYILKLMILSRRIDLNDEAGMERLNHLTGKALQQLEIPVG